MFTACIDFCEQLGQNIVKGSTYKPSSIFGNTEVRDMAAWLKGVFSKFFAKQSGGGNRMIILINFIIITLSVAAIQYAYAALKNSEDPEYETACEKNEEGYYFYESRPKYELLEPSPQRVIIRSVFISAVILCVIPCFVR